MLTFVVLTAGRTKVLNVGLAEALSVVVCGQIARPLYFHERPGNESLDEIFMPRPGLCAAHALSQPNLGFIP